MIQLGRKFGSKWFKATAEILNADIDSNEMKVKLTLPSGYFWEEDWNYQHAKLGFRRGEYYYLKSENPAVDSDAQRPSGVLHDVRESNASRSEPKASVESALGKITDTERINPYETHKVPIRKKKIRRTSSDPYNCG